MSQSKSLIGIRHLGWLMKRLIAGYTVRMQMQMQMEMEESVDGRETHTLQVWSAGGRQGRR